MKLTSQYKSIMPPSNCCLQFIFGREEPRPDNFKKGLKKRLNLMMLNNKQPLGGVQKSTEETQSSTFRRTIQEFHASNTPQRVKTARLQSLPCTPQPINTQIFLNSPIAPMSQRVVPIGACRSSHSLERKHQPIVKLRSSKFINFSQETQSRSTATSKEPLSSYRKRQDPFPIFQGLNSSEQVQSIDLSCSFREKQLSGINMLCKDVKASIYYEPQSQIPPPKLIRTLQFVKQIPSSQHPNEYAISRQPSKDVIEYDPEEEFRPKVKERSRTTVRLEKWQGGNI